MCQKGAVSDFGGGVWLLRSDGQDQLIMQNAFSSSYAGHCLYTFSWFPHSEACAVLWGIFVRGLRVETFVRVLRSSRVVL